MRLQELVNPDIFDDPINSMPMFGTKPVPMGDFMFDARTFSGGLGDSDAVGLQIRAYDPKKSKTSSIGSADFIVKKDKKGRAWLESDDTEVAPEYQGKGVATLMYAFAKSLGNDIKPSPYQSVAGHNMWAKWGKDAKNLSEGKDFNQCFDRACKLYDKAIDKNLKPKLVQVADFRGDGIGADPRWNKLPQHVWQHYVVIVGDQVFDPTARQFGLDMPTRYPVSDLDRLWGKQYQIRPREDVTEGLYGVKRNVTEFLDSLTPDDVGVDRVGPYRIHYEGFTDDCKSSRDYCRDPDQVYQQVFADHIRREKGQKPVEQGMVGDEEYPILYSVFRVKALKEGKITLSTDPN